MAASSFERAENSFRSWDQADSGVISYNDLCAVLGGLGLGEEVAKCFLADAKCISYQAFVQWAFGVQAPTGLGLSRVFPRTKAEEKAPQKLRKKSREQPTGTGLVFPIPEAGDPMAVTLDPREFSADDNGMSVTLDLREFDDSREDLLNEQAREMELEAQFEAHMRDLGGPILEDCSSWDQSFAPGGAAPVGGSQMLGQSCQLTKATDLLTGTRGPRGLKSLSLSAVAINASKTLAGTDVLNGTLSGKDAVHGSRFTWVRGETIGSGAMGSVFKAMDQLNGEIIAVKEVGIDEGRADDMKFRKALENEIDIIKNLRHPRIVSFFGSDCIGGNLYVYLEYMPGGSLAQVLQDFGALDETLCAVYTRDIVEGLAYLHSRDPPVLHRDIKGANILVSLDCRVKLTDFGCSKRAEDSKSATMRGSIPWMAPEVIKQTGAGRPADVWSLGCVVIEMATGKLPWGGFDNHMAAMYKIGMSKHEVPIPESLSAAGKDFIGCCVHRDKSKRSTAQTLLDHEFVGALLLHNMSDL